MCIHIYTCVYTYHYVYIGSAYAVYVPSEDYVYLKLKQPYKLYLHIGYSPDLCTRSQFVRNYKWNVNHSHYLAEHCKFIN